MSSKNRLSLIILTTLLTIGASGCGSAEPAPLTFWISQQTPQSVKDGIAAFGEQGGVEAEIVTIPDPFETNTLTKWTAGERPDVLYWQPAKKFFAQLVPRVNLQDLSGMDFVKKAKHRLAAESGAADGRTYIATVGFPSIFGLFYNRNVFAENKITPPKSYAELLAASKKLKAAGVTPMSIAGGDAWTMQVPVYELFTDPVAAGLVEKINTRAASWQDPAVVSALSTFKSYIDSGYANADHKTATYADQQSALLEGRAAMVAQASWMLSALAETAGAAEVDRSIGFVPWPTASAKVMWQSSNNASVMLPKTGDPASERAARDYVTYATTTGYRAYLDVAKEPSVIEGIADPPGMSALQRTVADAYAAGSIPSVDMQAAASFGDFPALVGELVAGRASAADVARTMQAEFEKNAKLIGVEGF
ncbi:raffinose/stachyose/melibiose transport system substrate-binding protein [Nonomuraea solani]|uniref:Raffinose/stachyose/melibiose transport system substrate-binding protein n=1 Tax=Nonomuraea solani TaxID=1144553 RepID=A0A1H6DV82_9ACTN|nr:extracellular solute-binding protein [Nonomuraea solani]SEG88663.1 raffinose/stachyose/melibiose transport system substrate-binding protein [Nonomuraea solani]